MGSYSDRMSWYRNDGRDGRASGVLPRWTLVDSAAATLSRGRYTTPTLGDLDADGDLDLLVGESSGALNYYRNDGGPRAPAFELVSDEFQDIDLGRRSVPTLVDLDGDGDLDLAVGYEVEGVRIFLNEGSRREPVFVETDPIPFPVPAFATPVFADLDGDGDLDFLTGGAGGGLVFYRRTGGPG